MASSEARIAVVEERLDGHDDKFNEVVSTLKDIEADVKGISRKLDKNLSFFAGVAFAFSTIGAAIGAVGTETIKKIFS